MFGCMLCSKYYHVNCLLKSDIPPDLKFQEGQFIKRKFRCMRCDVVHLCYKVKSVIAWRWREAAIGGKSCTQWHLLISTNNLQSPIQRNITCLGNFSSITLTCRIGTANGCQRSNWRSRKPICFGATKGNAWTTTRLPMSTFSVIVTSHYWLICFWELFSFMQAEAHGFRTRFAREIFQVGNWTPMAAAAKVNDSLHRSLIDQ